MTTIKTNKEQLDDVITKLESKGIHYIDRENNELHFKCNINPFFPKELTEIINLWKKIGNDYTFDRELMTLVVKNTNFPKPTRQRK